MHSLLAERRTFAEISTPVQHSSYLQESLANAKVSTRQQCVYEGP